MGFEVCFLLGHHAFGDSKPSDYIIDDSRQLPNLFSRAMLSKKAQSRLVFDQHFFRWLIGHVRFSFALVRGSGFPDQMNTVYAGSGSCIVFVRVSSKIQGRKR